MVNIWAKFGINGIPEKIDKCIESEARCLLKEYRIAFKEDGKLVKVWATFDNKNINREIR